MLDNYGLTPLTIFARRGALEQREALLADLDCCAALGLTTWLVGASSTYGLTRPGPRQALTPPGFHQSFPWLVMNEPTIARSAARNGGPATVARFFHRLPLDGHRWGRIWVLAQREPIRVPRRKSGTHAACRSDHGLAPLAPILPLLPDHQQRAGIEDPMSTCPK